MIRSKEGVRNDVGLKVQIIVLIDVGLLTDNQGDLENVW